MSKSTKKETTYTLKYQPSGELVLWSSKGGGVEIEPFYSTNGGFYVFTPAGQENTLVIPTDKISDLTQTLNLC